MRILLWNCKMALNRKLPLITALSPQIAVIPECANCDVESAAGPTTQTLWFGENSKKGLGVFAFAPWHIRRAGRPVKKWLVPIWVEGPAEFLLVAVWTTLVKGNYQRSFIGQACEAVRENPEWFESKNIVLCGDFNSNSIWDNTRKNGNHSWLVQFLSDRNILSAYHHYFNELQGAETRPTHYFYHRQDRPFHIDYVFISKNLAPKLNRLEVGEHRDWAKYSDHVPLIIDVDL